MFSGMCVTCLSDLRDDSYRFKRVIVDIHYFLFILNNEYPGFSAWYTHNVIPSIITGEKEILILSVKNKIIGVVILKKDPNEGKICTIRIKPEYRFCGLGKLLFKLAMQELNTEMPLITVSAYRLKQFERIFNYLGFASSDRFEDYYQIGVPEYSFNGLLEGTRYNGSIYTAAR